MESKNRQKTGVFHRRCSVENGAVLPSGNNGKTRAPEPAAALPECRPAPERRIAGGIAFVVTGVLTIIESSFIKGINSTFIMVAILLISIAVAYIYAYVKVKKSA